MITFDEDQWAQLKDRDANSFVAAVCKQFLANRPDMIDAEGRSAVHDRMQDAHDYAGDAGFTSTPHIVQFMYTAADYPGFHEDKHIDTYLRKPGASVEQRFDDLLAVLKRELSENQRNR